jgi:hypothetical protein
MHPRNLIYFMFICLITLSCSAHSQESKTSLIGNWDGSYNCAQGITGLTLIIDSQATTSQIDNKITGFFHFYPLKDNPEVKEGCYRIQGQLNALNQVKIEAEKWISRPAGYVMVDLEGNVMSSNKAMNGNIIAPPILGPTCTNFSISKKNTAPSIPQTCKNTELVTMLELYSK